MPHLRRATAAEMHALDRALPRWRRPGLLPGGLAAGRSPRTFDPDQLAIGLGIELEHTKRPEIALEIAMDHLVERKDYYARLEKMERQAEPKRSSRAKALRDKPTRPHNIEKSGFHRGEYVGYGRGTVWRIRRYAGGWRAEPRDLSVLPPAVAGLNVSTLAELSKKIA